MKKPSNYFKVSGFTLVELMVVVSVIGILASIVYANFGAARGASRDDIRKSALKEMQLAIELYKAQNGRYPIAGCSVPSTQWAGSETSGYGTGVTSCAGNYIVGLTPDFIATLPTEPGPNKSGKGYVYRVTADGGDYKLLSHHNIESKVVTSYSDEYARCPSDCGVSHCNSSGPETDVYAIYSAGAGCW